MAGPGERLSAMGANVTLLISEKAQASIANGR